MEALTEYWHQILFFIGVIIMGVRLESEVKSNRRDLNHLTDELDRRDTYVETVKHRAEIDIHGKQISTLWEFVNKLRDKMNGGPL
tara:strand:+ start:382 stop:636 length:255 start_codon:yes stop_codon:yes gene_type:complete